MLRGTGTGGEARVEERQDWTVEQPGYLGKKRLPFCHRLSSGFSTGLSCCRSCLHRWNQTPREHTHTHILCMLESLMEQHKECSLRDVCVCVSATYIVTCSAFSSSRPEVTLVGSGFGHFALSLIIAPIMLTGIHKHTGLSALYSRHMIQNSTFLVPG